MLAEGCEKESRFNSLNTVAAPADRRSYRSAFEKSLVSLITAAIRSLSDSEFAVIAGVVTSMEIAIAIDIATPVLFLVNLSLLLD